MGEREPFVYRINATEQVLRHPDDAGIVSQQQIEQSVRVIGRHFRAELIHKLIERHRPVQQVVCQVVDGFERLTTNVHGGSLRREANIPMGCRARPIQAGRLMP